MTVNNKTDNLSRGFTLVEVLVALVVISVGMLGIAALFVSSVQNGRGAIMQTKAVNLAADMADRIRANRTVPASYAGAAANGNCADTAVNSVVPCTAAQMAADDLFVWQATLADARMGLPGGVGTVVVNVATIPPTYTVTVSWNESGSVAPITYTVNAQM